MRLTRREALGGAAALTIAMPSVVLAQQKEFRVGILTPAAHPWNRAAVRVGDRLKAETNGRLSFTVFSAGQLGKRRRDAPADAVRRARHGLDHGVGARLPRSRHRHDHGALCRRFDGQDREARAPSRGDEAVGEPAARDGMHRPRLGHHGHARDLRREGHLRHPRHQGHEAAHQPDAGLPRLLPVARRGSDPRCRPRRSSTPWRTGRWTASNPISNSPGSSASTACRSRSCR